jgi:arginyl-tRNA synthetase
MKRFEDIISDILAAATGEKAELFAGHISKPPKPEMGDYAVPCFPLAKKFKNDPKRIAADLSEKVDLSGSPFKSVKALGPYVNFSLDEGGMAKSILSAVFTEGDSFGFSDVGDGQTVIVDYSSPNIAKPFHIGHLRSTVIGAALLRIYKALGYAPVGINHLGDWGTQFGMIMAAFDENRDEKALLERPISYSLELYVGYNKRCEDDPEAREIAKAWFKRLEDGDVEAVSLWKKFRDLSLDKFEVIYKRLGVHFDHYTGESFYNDKMESAIGKVSEAGILEKPDDGAELVMLDDMGMPPFIMRKSDGATLYATREVAAALYRRETFSPVLSLYVVGTPQELHFRQLLEVLKRMGCDWADKMVHIKFGHVHGMSTRKGEIVLLEDVLDEASLKAAEKIRENMKEGKLGSDIDVEELSEAVGIGSIIINDLKHRRERDIHFDWEQVLRFDGETGPYLQYSYARIKGIMRKSGKEISADIDYSVLSEIETRDLARTLLDFPLAVKRSAADNEPSYITSYLFDLTKAFNLFYNTRRVIGTDAEKELARILLVSCTGQVIKNGLTLLGVPVLERM